VTNLSDTPRRIPLLGSLGAANSPKFAINLVIALVLQASSKSKSAPTSRHPGPDGPPQETTSPSNRRKRIPSQVTGRARYVCMYMYTCLQVHVVSSETVSKTGVYPNQGVGGKGRVVVEGSAPRSSPYPSILPSVQERTAIANSNPRQM
jgi:hypothetical protein